MTRWWRRFIRRFQGLRLTTTRDRTAWLIRLARRERDIAVKMGWHEMADHCRLRAGLIFLSTYYAPP